MVFAYQKIKLLYNRMKEKKRYSFLRVLCDKFYKI